MRTALCGTTTPSDSRCAPPDFTIGSYRWSSLTRLRSTPRSARRISPTNRSLLLAAPVPTQAGLPPAGLIQLSGRTTAMTVLTARPGFNTCVDSSPQRVMLGHSHRVPGPGRPRGPRDAHLRDAQDRSIATLTLNRPERGNALCWPLRDELNLVLDDLDRDDDTRGLVVAANDKNFWTGYDLPQPHLLPPRVPRVPRSCWMRGVWRIRQATVGVVRKIRKHRGGDRGDPGPRLTPYPRKLRSQGPLKSLA